MNCDIWDFHPEDRGSNIPWNICILHATTRRHNPESQDKLCGKCFHLFCLEISSQVKLSSQGSIDTCL